MSHDDLRFLSRVPPDLRQAELIELVMQFAPGDGPHDTAIAAL